jgi:hypothetical protein
MPKLTAAEIKTAPAAVPEWKPAGNAMARKFDRLSLH